MIELDFYLTFFFIIESLNSRLEDTRNDMLNFGAFLYDFRDCRSEVHEREYDFENLLGCYKSVLIFERQ